VPTRLLTRCATALALLLTLLPLPLWAAQATVAVASNFTAPMKALAQAFERDTGHQLSLAFGATGQFYAQIRNGAPFAVLLSADDETPLKLEREGLAVAGTRFSYSKGRLALWSRQPGLVDTQGQVLRTGRFDKLAIANPKLAPYGAAALQTLQALGLRERVAPKLVEGANVTQAYQFAASGNAALAFVAVAQVFEEGQLREGSAWVVPSALHEPLAQDAVLLTGGQHNPAAAALLQYLRTENAQAIIRRYGYEVPPPARLRTP
jgi:molybdate transport system substrate-binding protein